MRFIEDTCSRIDRLRCKNLYANEYFVSVVLKTKIFVAYMKSDKPSIKFKPIAQKWNKINFKAVLSFSVFITRST